ncbi:1-deoxy-D-xylulose-5-phosphate reductoisomerase [Pelagibacterales bacterium SAG-MED48]|nr:1-deoxy-D-xylulose-5-phosphate reductoisomerase [Pelagibacterales bacterium SAG-MED48]
MKTKIAILGSTGSIGKTLLDIIRKDHKKFEIILLTADKNYKLLLKQAKEFKVKNLIITNKKKFDLIKTDSVNLNLNIYNNFVNFSKIFTNKVDYTMSSITGINGLEPTLKIIKYSKRIAIANKESIICGWNLIKKELKKNKTDFIPVDSEHFSLWYGIQNLDINKIEKIFLTASGGPFKNLPLNKFKDITIAQALKHPNWKMGKKISIDSATMINKIYEVIEAKNIFNCSYKKIEILIHSNSYVHAILKSDTGITKIIVHDTTMRVPIFNTLYSDHNKKLKSKKIDIDKLNNLDLKKINIKRYPMIRLLNLLPSKHSLFETVIVSANDTLVQLFLENKIKFTDIQKKLFNIINKRQFINYKNKSPKTIRDIVELNNYVRLKTLENNI